MSSSGESPLPGATERSVYTQAPSGPSPSEFLHQINYQGIEQFGAATQDTITKAVVASKSADAVQEGTQAVKRDPTTGELSVTYQPEIFAWDKARNDAASKAYVAESRGDIRLNALKIAQEYPNDPQGFQTVFKAYRNGLIAKAPAPVRGDLTMVADEENSRFTEGIFERKSVADVTSQRTSVDAEQNDAMNQGWVLARNGGEGTPDFQNALARFKSVTDAKVANPLFGYSKADQADDLAKFSRGAVAQAIIGHSISAAHAEGEQSGLDLLHTAIWGKNDLTLAERLSSESEGSAAIRQEAAERRAVNNQSQQQVLYAMDDAKAAGLAGKSPFDIVDPNAIIKHFGAFRGAQMIEHLQEAQQTGAMKKAPLTASAGQWQAIGQTVLKNPPTNAAPAIPSGFDTAWNFTLQHEGGYSAHDANGQPVNFGINQGANPDIDVSKLTPDKAKAIAKTRYWNPSGAGNLSPGMDAVHFDTAYIFGSDAANQMMAQANGDPQAYIDLRQHMMDHLVATQPEKYGRFEHSWERRNNDLRAFVSGAGQSSDFALKAAQYNAYQAASQERTNALATDPANYVLTGHPNIQAAVQSEDPAARAQGVRALLQTQADMGVPEGGRTILSKVELGSFYNQMLTSDPGQAVAAVSNKIAGLSSDGIRIIARQVAQKDAAFGAAISAAATDKQLAADIITGEKYLAQNSALRPKENNYGPVLDSNTAGAKSMFGDSGGLFQFAPDARASAVAATNALYARNNIGNSTATFDRNAWSKALEQVTGKPFNFRGQVIVAPREGLSSGDMEDLMRHVDDTAIKRFGNGWPIDASGRPLKAEDVSKHGVLTYTGTPGIYRVMFPGQGHLGVAHNPNAKTFQINLGQMIGAQ